MADLFAPSDETVSAVKLWLLDHGIASERLRLSAGKNWIRFDASVAEAEALLSSEYRLYEDASTGKRQLACDQYSVPRAIQSSIDFIMPTVHFDAKPSQQKKRRDIEKRTPPHMPGKISSGPVQPKQGVTLDPQATQVTFNTANCDTYITPDCLRLLYNFPNGTLNESSYGIVEYTPQAYLQSDLNLFYSNLARQIPSGTAPKVDLIDGAIVQTTDQSFDDNGESDLDLQYGIALVYPQKVTLCTYHILLLTLPGTCISKERSLSIIGQLHKSSPPTDMR